MCLCDISACENFNPRTPCGVRLNTCWKLGAILKFQSTHPMRGATTDDDVWNYIQSISIHAPHAGCDTYPVPAGMTAEISIHAPHAGCDLLLSSHLVNARDFNPRTPCGVRQYRDGGLWLQFEFQSTHPMRGATWETIAHTRAEKISIHAPHAGCDAKRK